MRAVTVTGTRNTVRYFRNHLKFGTPHGYGTQSNLALVARYLPSPVQATCRYLLSLQFWKFENPLQVPARKYQI
jgi:hypothetical protein